MPSFTKDKVAPAGRTQTLIFREIEKSVLSTLTVIDLSDSDSPNSTYVEIGIMSGGTTSQHKIATLASGYVGRGQAVSWTGQIITESEMFAYALVYSTPGGQFRLAGLVTPYIVSVEGGILLDP